jgi:DUF4097 and DUF4098 domain-containing protein YvlB
MKSILFASLLLLPSAIDAQGIIRDSYSGVKSIQLSTGSGDAIILRGSGPEVGLVIEYTYSDEVFKPKIRQSGDMLVLEEDIANRVMSVSRGQSTWTLTVPAGLDIRFSTGSGDLEVSDLDVNLNLSSGSGDMSLERVNGDIRHASGSGDLEIDSFSGTLRSATGSGDFSLSASNGDLSVATGSGDVDVDGHIGALKASTGSGDVTVEDLVANGDIKIATGSGDIDLELSAEAKGEISLASGSGANTLDLNGFAPKGEWIVQTSLNRGRVEAPFEFDSTREVRSNGNRYREYRKVFDESSPSVKISTGSGEVIILE